MNEINKKMVDKFEKAQMVIAIEELSELQKELCKALRGQENYKALVEEVADVKIILEQIIYFYSLSLKDIDNEINYKLERTKERYLKFNE